MDRMDMPSDIFTSRTAEEVTAALLRAGFRDPSVERPDSSTPWNVVVAMR
jgi:hypothetical protein